MDRTSFTSSFTPTMQANATTDALHTPMAIATPHHGDIIANRSSMQDSELATDDAGAITPSAVSAMMAAPQWSQLMPETTDVQEKKRIGTSSASSSASSSDDDDELATPWQSASDLPERRMMVHRIITLTEKKHAALGQAQQQSAATLAKRIELSLYSRANSLDEYRNMSTLRRRLQSLVALSCHEAAAMRALEQLPLSPKRRFPARNLGLVTPEFAIKRRRLTTLSSAQPKCSGRIFPLIGDDCVRAVFSFLDGREVLASRAINHFAATFLPSCVVHLELHVAQLRGCLESEDLSLRRFTNLERLTVYRQHPELNGSADVTAKRDTPLHAWGCSELDASERNDGEEVVQLLAAALDSGAARRLTQLQLVSVFSNTSQRNALRTLCDVLARGACPQLEDLLLGGNSMLDAGAADVARLLKSETVPALARLDLRRNYVGEAGLQRLVAALALGAGKKLRFLCMGGNIITDKCVAPLTALLAGSACPQLRFLGLEDNFLSPEGVQSILDAAAASGMAPRLHRASSIEHQQRLPHHG